MNAHTMTKTEIIEYIKKTNTCDCGKNVLKKKRKKSIAERFFAQFSDFMIVLLIIAALVSFALTFFSGEGDYLDAVIILVIVTLNAILGTIEEYRADNSLRALEKMSAPKAIVKRGGREIKIKSEDIRTGDILVLKMGDFVSADARLLSCKNLETDESSLTGEAMPCAKNAEVVHKENTPLAERTNMVYSGTSVVRGKAEAVVVAIGMDTEMGKIAGMIEGEGEEETPLQKKLASVGKVLGIGALVICALVFLLGVAKKIPPLSMFITAVSLAVAAIPEGLPATVTVVLSIGVMKMAKKRAIVKHLSAVETLGSATVICTDKTGTLTQNKMSVERFSASDELQLYEMAVLCCDDGINPVDAAIIKRAKELGIKKADEGARICEIPFDSERKMMSVMHRYYGKNRVITKGATEVLIKKCSHIIKDGKMCELTETDSRNILGEAAEMASDALRVIAVAYKDTPTRYISENALVFLGLIAFMDPPRPEAKRAVENCRKAGIKTVMITGDNIATARAIGKLTGILGKAISGAEMKGKTDSELREYSIFARVTPSDKLRIVKTYKQAGHIVAMTGDGVNDAPALKAADIGCSMGKKGTEVAKEASDLVLADDNFATIVSAVREGRGIFENIRKSIKFLLSSNIGEIITIFVGMLLGWPPPLVAIQLLWVNLVTDTFPALALGVDPVDDEIMKRPPNDPKKSIFADGMLAAICLEGAMIGALALLAFSIGKNVLSCGDENLARTMAFSVLSISQLFHAFNMRSEQSVLGAKFFENKLLLLSLVAGIALQIAVVNLGFLSAIFKTVPLDAGNWGIVIILSALPIVIIELQKLFNRKTKKE